MGIKEITIVNTGNWWTMIINYAEYEYGCSRPNLPEIVEELKYRIKSQEIKE